MATQTQTDALLQEDVGNIILMEHVNVQVDDQSIATRLVRKMSAARKFESDDSIDSPVSTWRYLASAQDGRTIRVSPHVSSPLGSDWLSRTSDMISRGTIVSSVPVSSRRANATTFTAAAPSVCSAWYSPFSSRSA